MEVISKIIKTFYNILAGMTISATVFITIFARDAKLSVSLLWQFIIIAAITALGNLIFYSMRELSKRQIIIRMVIHYIFINVIVVGGAILFYWIDVKAWAQVLVLVVMNAAVYITVTQLTFKKEMKTAEKLNQRLRKYNKEEEQEKI